MPLYDHDPHPHVEARKDTGPAKVADQSTGGINGRIALRLTALVGTMGAAYTFAGLALIALPSTLGLSWLPARTLLIVSWVSQTLIQLVMLAVLQLGQNLQARAADQRSEMTYLDAEAILHEVHEVHGHLEAQDPLLRQIADAVATVLAQHGQAAEPAPSEGSGDRITRYLDNPGGDGDAASTAR